MGMYNEVFKKCPAQECGGAGEAQIPQIVLGFGGFNLDNPDTMMELSEDEIRRLHSLVQDEWFHCKKCSRGFKLSETDQSKRKLIAQLFGT